jgi:hypothetical protein
MYSGELWSYSPLKDKIKEGWDKGYTCDNARSLTYKGKTTISILMRKLQNKSNQIYASRTEFPNDYINNKKSQGYFLTSITYDYSNKSWFIVMTKDNNISEWIWFNIKTQKDAFNKYFKNGYVIMGVY